MKRFNLFIAGTNLSGALYAAASDMPWMVLLNAACCALLLWTALRRDAA